MSKFRLFCKVFLVVCCFCAAGAAQEIIQMGNEPKVSIGQNCQDLKLGRALNFPKPNYPREAKTAYVGGTVRIEVAIDEKGKVAATGKFSGHPLLQNAATNAAQKTKFTISTCDGAPIKSVGVLTYNFVPVISTAKYFTPAEAKEFGDLKADSKYYAAIADLTENYELGFGYADKKFYADAPLVRGDFIHFLRLTLDLLSAKAAAINKLPREINLFQSRNPQKLTAPGEFKDLKRNAPFYDSAAVLLQKYDIALLNEKGELRGDFYLTNNEVIDLWTEIFGAEAIPVNFTRIAEFDPIMTRGEFALFLQESLQVLTYKVLP